MATRWGYIWGLLFLLLHFHDVVAGPLQVLRREDATPTITVAPKTTTTGNEETDIETSSERTGGTKTTQTPTTDMSTTIMATSTTAFPSAINGNSPGHNNSLATPSPIPEGQLPLDPRLTPGWGVAGALLLISGAAYTLIGIKNAWLHTYFSAAFLSGLSVTVLIVYVMTPPVPAAIEGAYVVAAVVTGLILGGAAIAFREITEGLGCLLGGFCVSMWLLTLKPGGLLPSTTSKVIFIAAFSVGSYGFYFSRYTRPYAQMGLMSFAGGTVTVIGIDCFSRAGLKEFWAYIWNLNKGLFPYAANTYPLTKGIRVEIALTVVFTIIGIISQVKLWRVIQERRAKKAEEQAEEQGKRDEEEANLGLQVEAQNARERRQWETVYGDQPPRSLAGSEDSGVEDMDDEKTKKIRISQNVVRQVPSNEDVIEMAELPSPDHTSSPDPAKKSTDGIIMTSQNDDSRTTIKVAQDDEPTGHNDVTSTSDSNEKVWIVNGNGEARPSSIISSHTPQMSSKLPGPDVTPLPFKIPSELDGNESRSSIATYADEDDRDYVLSQKPSRLSLTNRLSVSSGNLLQSLSQRSVHSRASKRKTGEFGAQQSPGRMGSTEELVENSRRYSDALSIAATIDYLSQDGDAYDYSTKDKADRVSIPTLTVDFGGNITEPNNADNKGDSETKLKPPNSGWRLNARPTSSAETVGTDILDLSIVNSSSGDLSKRSSLNQSTKKTESTNGNSNPTDITAIEATSESSVPPKSPVPSITSTNMNLTKDRLPSALTRVALSYRTNEWAKHLSAAEVPQLEQLEQLQLDRYPDQQDAERPEAEAAAPVRVEELQQTAESVSPPAMTRPSSSASNLPQVPSPVDRSSSRISSYSSPKVHIPATLAILTSASSEAAGTQVVAVKPTPSNIPQAGHSFRNKRQRKSSEVYNQPIQEEDGHQLFSVRQPTSSDDDGNSTPNSTPPSPTGPTPIPGVVSYSSPQTLLGKRDMFLRNKSQSQLFTTPPIQENSEHMTRPASQLALPYNYTAPPPPPLMAQDIDDIPLSQRKELMRQNSMLSVNSVNSTGGRPKRNSSSNVVHAAVPNSASHIQIITAESSNFDSHQPRRHTQVPSQASRDARLSQFRQSVAAELRAPTPVVRETLLLRSTSSTSLIGPSTNNAEVSRAIDLQRNVLMSQREQEAQRREMERWEKEQNDRAFEEMMRNGGLIDAHREALRRMQGGVKHE
ncbi:hypothetical protein E0Z10_g7232 [Xylaria hypoxylon]|uniref:TM7S3/TM198-like domain-containing protein n=1 Tax=Xylaria hypoxylon TaxID=37992 RepID=A0A4Z0YQV1_9PEZI|nr:hypothetical protein E0Z10_g7232 [Xylaria hypoxylon]